MGKTVKTPEYLQYKRYIASKEFDDVRNAVFTRDNNSCTACGWNISEYNPDKKSLKRTLHCHHKTYVHLYDEMNHLDDLTTLCNVCHLAIHRAPSNFSRFKKPGC